MDSINLSGLGVALVTPFDNTLQVDYEALRRVLHHILENGVDYIVVLGTTGETPTLTADEKKQIRAFIRNEVKVCGYADKVPLVAGIGGNNTQAVIDEIRTADLEGYSAILSVTPFYNKPSQEGLFMHFSSIAAASPLPLILYNVPGRTGVNLSASTTLRLAHECPSIIAIKEASGTFKQIEAIINGCPEGFQVISGDDALTYPLLTLGAQGVISVVGNAFPREFGDMVRRCLKGRFSDALPTHYSFQKLYDELFVDGNPAGIKCLLHEMGLIENVLRLPLVPTRIETKEKIHIILRDLRSAHAALVQ